MRAGEPLGQAGGRVGEVLDGEAEGERHREDQAEQPGEQGGAGEELAPGDAVGHVHRQVERGDHDGEGEREVLGRPEPGDLPQAAVELAEGGLADAEGDEDDDDDRPEDQQQPQVAGPQQGGDRAAPAVAGRAVANWAVLGGVVAGHRWASG